MKLDLKYDINLCCKMVLQEQLDKMQLSYTITGLGVIEIKGKISDATYKELEINLIKYGIERAKQEIIEDKDTLTEIPWNLNYSSVAHLSNEFKRITGLTPTAFK